VAEPISAPLLRLAVLARFAFAAPQWQGFAPPLTDARKASVRLTQAGLNKISEAVEDHIATQAELVSCLS